MAHSCPDCGSICYCGGDIDDINFGDDCDAADLCTHCTCKVCHHMLDHCQCDPPDYDDFDDDEP